MSFNRLNYDKCQYKHTLYESTGPGNYMLGTPPISCDYCFPAPPTIRLQKAGNSIHRNQPLVDTHSDLLNIPRKASKCCRKQWKGCMCKTQGKVESTSSSEEHEHFTNPFRKQIKPAKITTKQPQCDGCSGCTQCSGNADAHLKHWKSCFVPAEDTRTTEPACNLRGTGFNRWEWLCKNPQEQALIPFDYNVANRIVVKDNHRPCVPTPVDQRLPLPNAPHPLPCPNLQPVCGNFTESRV